MSTARALARRSRTSTVGLNSWRSIPPIARGMKGSAIYESGRFTVDGDEVVGGVLFWWSENSYTVMEGAPAGRGQGWSEDYEAEVLYAPLDAGGVAISRDVPHSSMAATSNRCL